MTDLWKLSAVEVAAGVRAKEFKPSEVVDSVLARVAARNGELNAITYDLADQARARSSPGAPPCTPSRRSSRRRPTTTPAGTCGEARKW